MSEVLGWTAFFLSAECLCAWAWATRRQVRWLLLLFFASGAALSNHLMAVLSLAVWSVWLVVEVVRRRAPVWLLAAAAGVWLAGGTLYWIVVALEYARTGSAAETLVSATVGRFGGAAGNLGDLPRLFGRSLLYLGLNHPTPLVLAAAPGLVALVRRRDGLAWAIVALAAVYFLWAARYDVPDQFSFFVPFYVLSSVLIGLGAGAVLAKPGRWRLAALLVLALVPVAVYAALPSAARAAGLKFFKREVPYRDPYVYFLQPWKRGDWGARRFAEEALAGLPQNAVLLPDSTTAPPLQCLQDVEGKRRDVLIVSPYDALFMEHLGRYWQSEGDLLPEIRAEGRRAFVVSDHAAYIPRWVREHGRLEPFGVLHEVTSRAGEDGP
jgi:hypothetical protein